MTHENLTKAIAALTARRDEAAQRLELRLQVMAEELAAAQRRLTQVAVAGARDIGVLEAQLANLQAQLDAAPATPAPAPAEAPTTA